MAEFFFEYGLFAAKLATFVVAILVVVIVSVGASRRVKKSMKGHIETSRVNDEIDAMRDAIDAGVSDPDSLKLHVKQKQKQQKRERKARKKALARAGGEIEADAKPRVFVLDFVGNLKASAVSKLRREITAVLSMARARDAVVVRLESGGGMVHAYGLASSQLQRIRDRGIDLTVCVDKVAASGGYMMACVANRILAAPFAILGSIGVVAQLPNFHRLLESKGIDYEQVTAGRFKRTLTMFGQNTDEARAKMQAELEEIHDLFKAQIVEHRAQVDIESVATGEHWYGLQAIERKLIDSIQTSDDYLQGQIDNVDIYRIEFKRKKPLPERIMHGAESLLAH